MSTHVNVNFDPVVKVAYDFIRMNHPGVGSSQKETARLDGILFGQHKYMAEAIAHMLTAERVAIIKPYMEGEERPYVITVDGHVIMRWLQKLRTRWDGGEWKDQSDAAFALAVRGELNELAIGDWYDQQVEPQRRRAVLAGRVDPEPEDEAWIEEERKQFAAVVRPYDHALEKARLAARHRQESAELEKP